MKKLTCLAQRSLVVLFFLIATGTYAQQKPNIIFILTDDMGYGDISCFNGTYQTPNIDQLAKEGIRLTHYYSASPVCSPSRTGLLTGQAPAKWHITNYLSDKKHNATCEQADFLDPSAPTIAKLFKANGYATGHFGKWHMGGGRDVKQAPNFDRYGFDEWNSTWESPDPDPLLTASDWIWSDQDSIKRWNRTAYFVDKTIAFLKKHRGTPCFINLWPDDVHTPWVPGGDYVKEYGSKEETFIPVLKEYDQQIGRLMKELKKEGLDKNTIVVFTSDNGPAPNFRHDRSAGMRGAKVSLYEGGIRMPFMMSWPGHIKAAQLDTSSVVTANDMIPTLCKMAGIANTATTDGEDRSQVMMGKPVKRKRPIFWEYGRNDISFNYPPENDRSPSIAMLQDNWKLLMNKDRSRIELYDIAKDPHETTNIAGDNKELVDTLGKALMDWWNGLPGM